MINGLIGPPLIVIILVALSNNNKIMDGQEQDLGHKLISKVIAITALGHHLIIKLIWSKIYKTYIPNSNNKEADLFLVLDLRLMPLMIPSMI